MFGSRILDLKSEIHSKTLDEDILDLSTRNFQYPVSFDFTKTLVSEEATARMDIISRLYYGSDVYTSVLCKLNAVSNPFELNEDDVVVLPNVDQIDDFYRLTASWDENEDEDHPSIKKPTPKDKKAKRGANEAVVGDKRYRIDNANKIIIY